MPSPLDSLLALLVRVERGELARTQIHSSMRAKGFTEAEVMSAQGEARAMGYTTSDGWSSDKLTDTGREYGRAVLKALAG